MNIGVFVKQVIDVSAVTVDVETGKPKISAAPVMNTFDAYGVGEAVDLKETYGGHVTAIGLGPESIRDVLMRALATGADEAILIKTDSLKSIDSLMTARLLADAVRNGEFDVLIAGQTSDDYENGQVGIQIAEMLGVPHVSCVVEVQDDGNSLLVQRDWEGSKQCIRLPKPAMLVMLTGRSGPRRHASLKGMMQAKRKPVHELAPDIMPTTSLSWSEPGALVKKSAGIIVEGEPADVAAAKLADWLREHRLVG